MVTISNLGNLQQKNMADVCLDSDLTYRVCFALFYGMEHPTKKLT